MIIINNNNTDPFLNHAIEEHLIDRFEDECFMLWQNSPCLLIGRNQNVYQEINMDFVKEQKIDVVRRITGGGTVYNDWGNFNFTFISKNKDDFSDFKKFTIPILSALNKLGANARFEGRNDLVIDGKKISGNAQCKLKGKLLHHGTLLFDVNLENLARSLNPSFLKLESKAVASVKSRVTNIIDYLDRPLTIDGFRKKIVDEIKSIFPEAIIYDLTQSDLIRAEEIALSKYRQRKWNFPDRIDFTIRKEKKFPAGLVQIEMEIHKGKIKNISFYGDFFNEKDIGDVVDTLKGIEYQEKTIKSIMDSLDLDLYFKNIPKDCLLGLII
ncbi:MAG: lipoate--protein ligase [Bacillota bacterium]|nr:lipoate--protein ligase [Bacillota bacterium]